MPKIKNKSTIINTNESLSLGNKKSLRCVRGQHPAIFHLYEIKQKSWKNGYNKDMVKDIKLILAKIKQWSQY